MMNHLGYSVVIDDAACITKQPVKSVSIKRWNKDRCYVKRISKKFSKLGFKEVHTSFMFEGKLVVSTAIYEKLKQAALESPKNLF